MGGSRYERVRRSALPTVDNQEPEARATAVIRPEATESAAAALGGGPAPSVQSVARLLPKLCVVAADFVAVSCAMLISFWLRSFVPGTESESVHTRHLTVALVSLPVWGICFSRYRLYRARNVASRYDEFVRISHAVFASVLGMAVVGFLL